MVKQRKPKRHIDDIGAAEQKVKRWSTAIVIAVHKLRYYQKRLSALQAKRLSALQHPPPTAPRAIRLR